MEITISIKSTTEGFLATLDVLPEFSLISDTKANLLDAFPEALKDYLNLWEATVSKDSTQFAKEFSFIQRIKARGYYQSTIFRLQELMETKDLQSIDIEVLHCLQRKGFESLLATNA